MHITTQSSPPTILKLLADEVRWRLVSRLAYSDYRVQELSRLLQKPLNLISYHLRLLRNELIVHEQRSSADGRDVYYSLNFENFQGLYQSALESVHPALAEQTKPVQASAHNPHPPKRVLFLCTHICARSQIADALLLHLGGGHVEVFSAGTEPSKVHPMALEVLTAQGIDTTALYSKSVENFHGQRFDYVITVCDRAKESCPIFPGDPEQIHWSFPDPSSVADPDAQRMAFMKVFVGLEKRLKIFLALFEREWSQS